MSGSEKVTGHTPGPWEYRRDGNTHYVGCGVLMITDAVWGSVAAVDSDTHKANHEEREANARLIAAAPDLLEALKDLMTFVPDSSAPDTKLSLCRKAAVEAIRRAEGR